MKTGLWWAHYSDYSDIFQQFQTHSGSKASLYSVKYVEKRYEHAHRQKFPLL